MSTRRASCGSRGNAANDSAIFKYTKDGKPVLTIGKLGPTGGSNDTTLLGRPADIQVDADAKEVFVADGYGNRRVIVFDSETGAYKRHWGAYGNKPNDDKQAAYDPAAAPSQQFANPVHCAKAVEGRHGLCLRPHQQPHPGVQEGRHLRHRVVLRQDARLGAGAVWDLNFWPDANQTWLFNIDGENNLLRILQRQRRQRSSAASAARAAAPATSTGSTASPSTRKGNIYTGEVDNGKARAEVQAGEPGALAIVSRLAVVSAQPGVELGVDRLASRTRTAPRLASALSWDAIQNGDDAVNVAPLCYFAGTQQTSWRQGAAR